MRIVLRYAVFQLPGMFVAGLVLWTLVRWEQLTAPVAGVLFALWVAKDVALFPITRAAFSDDGVHHGPDALLGSIGTTRDGLAPGKTGYVTVGPERWRALLADGATEVDAGERVRVVAVNDLTLRVEPA
jgi:membrane protein implicated in regulation of membrane protease activity